MARQGDSTATQQDQPPKEFNPKPFDEILGLKDPEFREFYEDDRSDLSELTDDQLEALADWYGRVDPQLKAFQAQEVEIEKKWEAKKAAAAKKYDGPEGVTLDQIDQLVGKLGFQQSQLDNLLRFDRKDADPAVNPLEQHRLSVTDEPSVPQPCILASEDGGAVLYAGRFSSIHGEPGTGKSWFALIAAGEAMKKGGRVLWMDAEDRPSTVADRSRPLGLLAYVIQDQHFGFYNSAELVEVEENTAAALEWLRGAKNPRFSLVVLDSAESWGAASDGASVQEWIKTYVEPWRTADIAVLLLDHVPKRPKDRPAGAIGSQRKRAAIDGAALRVIGQCWTKIEGGSITLICEKDRVGDMPGMQKAVATLTGAWDSVGAFAWQLTAPATSSGIESEKVEAVFSAIEAAWPEGIHGTNNLQAAAGMRKAECLEAVAELLRTDRIVKEQAGRGFTFRTNEAPNNDNLPESILPDKEDKQSAF